MTNINALVLESLSDYFESETSNPAVVQNNYQKPAYPINYQPYNYYNYYNQNNKDKKDEEEKPKGGILGALALSALGAGAGIGAYKLSQAHAPKAAYYGLKGKFSGNIINKVNNYSKAAKHAIQSPMIRNMALKKVGNFLW